MTRYSKTTRLMLAALFTALTAICAYISIPLPFTPVPITLATLAATLSGALLGPKYGVLSQVVYLLLGAVGVPVFHNFTGGLGILTGPTGGYLIGYLTMAFLTGLIICQAKKGTSIPVIAIAMIIGLASCYLLGTAWFMISSGTALIPSLVSCVIPFLPGDAVKTIVGCFLIKKLRPILN